MHLARLVNPGSDRISGLWAKLMSELENPDAVERSASHQPSGRIKLEDSIKQWRKGTGASIDVFQQTTVIDWGNLKSDEHPLSTLLLKSYNKQGNNHRLGR